MHLTKSSLNLSVIVIYIFITSCSTKIYENFEDPILVENLFEVNDSIVRKDPVSLLIQPSPINKFIGYPLGLAINNLASKNPDEKFDEWLKKNNRESRLNKLISQKQIAQLKRYNKSFNNFLKELGQEPVTLSDINYNDNIRRLKQFYNNIGYFDSEISYNTTIDNNQAKVKYRVKTNDRYLLDSITVNIQSKDLDYLYKANIRNSILNKGEYFSINKLLLERDRIFSLFKNNGIYNFQQRSISYNVLIDSTGVVKKIPIIINISNPNMSESYKIKRIDQINLYIESLDELSNIESYTDSINYNGVNIFSKGNLKYSPKSIIEPIFFKKGDIYSEENKILTSRYFSNLGNFKYPRIIMEEKNDSLVSSIYLLPRNRFSLGFDLDFTHSNIEDFGISFGTNLNIRNIFRGVENLSINLKNSIGASRDIGIPDDSFFNLFELGGNINLRIPRAVLPLNTNKIIKKNMNPSTNIILGSTVQKNIGLDKQYYSGIYEVNWNPSLLSKINFKLLDFEYVNNQNISNYFNVYRNSYDKLNYISSLYNIDRSLVDNNGDLTIPRGSDLFINQVLNNQTSLSPNNVFYKDVNSILERKERLTENNLIIGSSITINRNTQENFLDEDFSQLRIKLEMVGNIFNELLRGNNLNSNGKVEISNILPSQYTKAEINYIKHLLLNKGDIIAIRVFSGIAIPYGNSNYIPFTRSYYAGGSNDNRAWKAYKLGPGSSNNINDFNEANFKIAFNLEYRSKINGKLNGAFFVDVGNIWNLNDNVDDSSMTFDSFSDLGELAIGSGFGLRYDLNFFVLRLDTGFKTYNPVREKSERWFNDFTLRKAVFNIGINYPF
ncbi:MAG: BamA/TamA family outer membrane protein [Flavobacteriaceae bacterium]